MAQQIMGKINLEKMDENQIFIFSVMIGTEIPGIVFFCISQSNPVLDYRNQHLLFKGLKF
jgi:lipid II:glycine glycyltransferase (peptidoglycan interpeptide bridge formation enzyme)